MKKEIKKILSAKWWTGAGVLVSAMLFFIGLVWGSFKLVPAIQNINVVGVNNGFNADNMVFNGSTSIGTQVPLKPTDKIQDFYKDIANQFRCNYEDGKCDLVTLTISPSESTKNVRLNLPGGKQYFAPFLTKDVPTVVGLCLKGNDDRENCIGFNEFSISNYPGLEPCMDVFYDWEGASLQVRDYKILKNNQC